MFPSICTNTLIAHREKAIQELNCVTKSGIIPTHYKRLCIMGQTHTQMFKNACKVINYLKNIHVSCIKLTTYLGHTPWPGYEASVKLHAKSLITT